MTRVWITLIVLGAVGVLVISPTVCLAQGDGTLTVTFELNDAQVKDRALSGVEVQVRPVGDQSVVATGVTGPDGRWSAALAAGTYRASFSLAGYVPYTSELTEVRRDGQLVTVSLSPMLEATGEVASQVRIILNWGSQPDQVRDVDSHLACPCQEPPGHVSYSSKVHEGEGHRVELDVDDTDWGGPETVTLTDPPAGSYLYWVHDYSAGPGVLGSSDIVVRVVIGDHEAGEFRVLKGVGTRAWRPFKAIAVGADGQATVVRFTPDEIADGLDLQVREDLQPPETLAPATPSEGGLSEQAARLITIGSRTLVFALVAVAILVVALIRRRRMGATR